ncbi:MAG: hypothetical protein OXC95_13675 [Dehalococcoidia bacterium]|nr:hypothetical protein [Dehalococcoidia bacterium]
MFTLTLKLRPPALTLSPGFCERNAVKVCRSAAIFVLCALALACSPFSQLGSESKWTIAEDEYSRTGTSAQLLNGGNLPSLRVFCWPWHNSQTQEWTVEPILEIQWDENVVDDYLDYLQVEVGWDGLEPESERWTTISLDSLYPDTDEMGWYIAKLRDSETLYLRVVRLDSDATFQLPGSGTVLESFEDECRESVPE